METLSSNSNESCWAKVAAPLAMAIGDNHLFELKQNKENNLLQINVDNVH